MKKGQITIFVILGFVVLLLVGLSLFFLFDADESPGVPGGDGFRSDRVVGLGSLTAEIESCISSLTIESLQTLSLQGGHLDVEDYRYDLQPAYRNNAISVFGQGEEIVPIWLTLQDDFSCDDCNFEYNRNTLETIQWDVEDFVRDNLEECMDGFVEFRNRFDVDYEDIEDVEIIFTEDDVVINTIWEMQVLNEETNRVNDISRFQTSVDIPFRHIYETAEDIFISFVTSENIFKHYMTDVRDFVILSDELPPAYPVVKSGFDSYRAYNLMEGQEVLNQQLYQNLDAIQLIGAQNSFWLEEEEDDHMNQFYDSNRYFLQDNDFLSNLRVDFAYYPDWNGYLDVWPSRGPIVLPEVNDFSFFFFSSTDIEYDLRYDMSYPFMISLSHEDSLSGEGFDFRFGVEANLQRNQAMGEAEIFGVDEPAEGAADLMDPRHSTIPLEYTVVDGITSEPREGYELYFECMDTRVLLGTTDSDGKVSREVFPCIDAMVTLQDMEARAEPDRFTTVLGQEYEGELQVYEPVEVEVQFKKLGVRKDNLRLDGGIPVWDYELTTHEIDIEEHDEFFLVMNSLTEYELPFTQVLEINGSDLFAGRNNTLELLPDRFEMFAFSNKDIMLSIGEENIELEEETLDPDDDVSIGPVPLRSGSTTTVNGSNITDTVMDGYFALEQSEDRYYSVQPADLSVENPVMTVYLKSFDPFYDANDDPQRRFGIDPDSLSSLSASELLPYANKLLRVTREMDIMGEIAEIQDGEISMLEPRIRNKQN